MNGVNRFVTRTRVEGLVIFLVAAGYLWEAHNVPEFYQIPGVPGPTTFPRLLGIVFALCGLWLLASPQEWAARRRGAARPGAAAPAPGTWVSGLTGDWHFYTMWAVILGYLWFMPDLGFPVSTFILLVVFIALLGERRLACRPGAVAGGDGPDLRVLQDGTERPPAPRRPGTAVQMTLGRPGCRMTGPEQEAPCSSTFSTGLPSPSCRPTS